MTGFSAGYIAYSEIVLWLNEHMIDSTEQRLEYIKWIQFIDSEYVHLQHEKHREMSKKKSKRRQ